MSSVVLIVLILAYVIVTNLLFLRAARFAKDQTRVLMVHQAVLASSYTDEGQPYRRAAIRVGVLGAVVVVIALLVWGT